VDTGKDTQCLVVDEDDSECWKLEAPRV
jgi:hypothetical protein